MAIGNVGIGARLQKVTSPANQRKTFVGRYFYLVMSLVMTAVVIAGFSRTVDANLFHANPPRPLLLWFHGAAFSAWLVVFISQSALVRVRKVSVHRLLGWAGAVLAAAMVVLGTLIPVVMTRFHVDVLHEQNVESFMSVPFCDMIAFATFVSLAIYFRKKPEFHRRLLYMATCHLLDAGIGRFDFFFDHNLIFPFVDAMILLGVARDRYVDGRVNQVYIYALPPVIVMQTLAMYLWRANPAVWQTITRAILAW